jgi:putative cardiolipin synthase
LRIGPKLKVMLDAAKSEVFITSPYFVPGDTGTQFLTALVQRGVTTQVLTNSLAATDETAAHSGYSRYRRRLLEGGVRLYELRPDPGAAQPVTSRGTSSGVSLHAKTLVVDREHVFIGSLNMDQRSKLLNTEMGVIIDSAPLAQAVREYFDAAILPANSFHVVLQESKGSKPDDRQMQWQWSVDGKAMSDLSDPDVSKRSGARKCSSWKCCRSRVCFDVRSTGRAGGACGCDLDLPGLVSVGSPGRTGVQPRGARSAQRSIT